VTRRDSFDSIGEVWLKEAKEYFPNNDVVFMMIANKVDLPENRTVTEAEAEAFARKNGMMYIETSAKTKKGIQEAFEELANKILDSPFIKPAAGAKGKGQTLTGSTGTSDESEGRVGCC
jgi:Ras-related protein Rab-18